MSGTHSSSGFEALTGLQAGLLGPLTVSQATRMVRDTLRAVLPPVVSVVGQISNFRPAASGHAWFTLKDDRAQLSCVMWADKVRQVRFRPEDGLEVVASGNIDVYAAQGRYQLYVERIEPVGVGALELAFRQLYEKLRNEGLFDETHKKPLPRYPDTIALVTSPTGAAVRDMIRTIGRRWPAARIIVVPVRVQGEKAAAEIARAVRRVDRLAEKLAVDLMIVGRGGGSIEDLWPFNDEAVARAIFASKVPVISAVGHERDTTIADLVADARAATPTHAGEMAVRVRDEVLAEIDDLTENLTQRISDRLQTERLRMQALEKEPCIVDPAGRIRQALQNLDRTDLLARNRLQGQLATQASRLAEIRLRMQRVHPRVQLAQVRTHLRESAARLGRASVSYRQTRAGELAAIETCLRQLNPVRQADALGRHLAAAAACIEMVLRRDLRSAAGALDSLQARLEASSPRQILQRGFTMTRLAKSGKLITAADQVRPGTVVRTETAAGHFDSAVGPGSLPSRPPPRRPAPGDQAQLDLPLAPPDEGAPASRPTNQPDAEG